MKSSEQMDSTRIATNANQRNCMILLLLFCFVVHFVMRFFVVHPSRSRLFAHSHLSFPFVITYIVYKYIYMFISFIFVFVLFCFVSCCLNEENPNQKQNK